MHDALRRLAGSDRRLVDAAAAAALAVFCTLELLTATGRGAGLTLGLAAATALGCGAIVIRRRHPLAVAIALCPAFVVPGAVLGVRWSNALPDALLIAVVILAYTVGFELDGAPAVIGLIALSFATTAGDLSGGFVSMWVFTVPGWAAGRVMQSRTRLTVALAARARELEQEREAFAHEAVRYERARIARDLHDIVAHSVSMIVVQAGAGRRALASSPATAAESLRHIEGGAHQAELEIEHLLELLGDRDRSSDGGGLGMLDELVRRAAATGLSVSYRFSGAHDDVPAELTDAAYHVTQEGITNALKHAPGAPITVEVHADGPSLSITVENGPPAGAPSGLETAGGAYGLGGLRDRLRPVGGSVQAGPTPAGGWRLAAQLPRVSGSASS